MKFLDNIIIGRFPKSFDIIDKYSDCQVIINVSDEFFLGNSEQIMRSEKLNYYFPMGESNEDMGLSSIYGALQVLHQIYTWNRVWKVLLHCQAGRNRSPTIKDAFCFMMTGKHEPDSRMIRNCEEGHLPPIEKMELFLSKCRYTFDHPECFFGGMFDWVMAESGLAKRPERDKKTDIKFT